MNLKNVALYSKHWYQRSGDIWEDIKTCLKADDYMPDNKQDILNIVIRNVAPFFKSSSYYNIEQFTPYFIDEIAPYNCWKYGFYHKKCAWAFKTEEEKNSAPEYDYQTAILYFFLSRLANATITECDGLPNPDKKVLPLSKNAKKHFKKIKQAV